MQSISRNSFLKIFSGRSQSLKGFHLSSVDFVGKWRQARNLPPNPNSFGPLTNLPDYSFKDGRPVPFGSNQKKRIDKQRENLVLIKQLAYEVDNAVVTYEQLQKQKEVEKQQIIDRKLKEKGDKLLKK